MPSKSLEEVSEDKTQVLWAEAKDVDDTPNQNWLTRKLLTLGVEARGTENVTLSSVELKSITCFRDFPGAFGRQS